MDLNHIVAATDESDAGRQAVWTACEVAAQAGARVTVLRVVPLDHSDAPAALERVRRWVESDLPLLDPIPPIAYALAHGLPGIEIGRFAEQSHADLLVLGRKPRSRIARLLLGDTADAVARRSRLPCLFVPSRGTSAQRLLVALEGSERGSTVLRTADAFAQQVGADLRLLTVESVHTDEPAYLAAGHDARTKRAHPVARPRDARA